MNHNNAICMKRLLLAVNKVQILIFIIDTCMLVLITKWHIEGWGKNVTSA